LDSNPGLLNLLLDKKIGISIKMILNKFKKSKMKKIVLAVLVLVSVMQVTAQSSKKNKKVKKYFLDLSKGQATRVTLWIKRLDPF
jgi:hypothetical protein